MIQKIDHFVITSKDILSTVEFYKKLGFIAADKGIRYELYAGDFKINVHTFGKEISPYAKNIKIGSSDFCLEIKGDLNEFYSKLKKNGVNIEVDTVQRNGAKGTMKSIYIRDPDGNLIELCSYE